MPASFLWDWSLLAGGVDRRNKKFELDFKDVRKQNLVVTWHPQLGCFPFFDAEERRFQGTTQCRINQTSEYATAKVTEIESLSTHALDRY